jgi:DNA-binding transcriptional LysR family regulator
LDDHAIDLCVIYRTTALTIPNLRYQEVGWERFKVCVNANHSLAQQGKIRLEQLREEPFVICERATSPGYYDTVLDICAKRDFEPRISQKVAEVSNIYCLVDAGLGVAIASCSQARSYPDYNIKFVDLDDEGEDLINYIVVAWRQHLSPQARRFKDLAKATYPDSSRPIPG